MRIKQYLYKKLFAYISFYVRPGNSVLVVEPDSDLLVRQFLPEKVTILNRNSAEGSFGLSHINSFAEMQKSRPEYVLLNGNLHYERDIIRFLEELHEGCCKSTRIIATYYSSLWKPVMKLGTLLGLRKKTPELNWLAHPDVENLFSLAGFEKVRLSSKILIPIWVPLLSDFVNRYIAPLPFFRIFSMLNIVVARPIMSSLDGEIPSVSVVVAARNESGNIESIINRVPKMGPKDELIFVEGNSIDDTWEKIQEMQKKYCKKHEIVIAQQDGKGKGDAVRKGFSLAKQDILMILDADMTVPPEDLTKFYKAISSGLGEYINGSRLVYPMEKKAMRFFNILGNKFFAVAFSFVLEERIKDTLCGTKVISRENYLRLANHRAYFGDFDPFGDFDLIFGAARMGLKFVELPIIYKARTYGDTNIQRWRHGVILFRMLLFAARKIKFI